MSFLSALSPLFKNGFAAWKIPSASMIVTRSLMKTHKGAAKRWRKNANGFKRGISGRKHGNCGWSQRGLKALTGRTEAHQSQIKRLKKLLPYH
ncbi:mitochondrial 54S ribosomal protein bL35m KNAG_0I02130 [Huiozyma naganishii CBS 8797]|uniref:50S ribosomal protein L35 n=1 Tax=Huiozyma naganishii (strain ATCC MYA-139 / BCRC 22969 / CBS 8797 / KCTC 17520 / NBRC 10181 / NCYC 3082 / Yp74L-3) TaxID=1071383 RepID=J7RQF2_HUIN7|nr:hypothetical protein KNAG_0I02130 [Kazachstania naganishii CBS 8797]CCK71998.1 hypothetical protein KNAG_0I02130 [Kazachstania naganishii CBS 8797]